MMRILTDTGAWIALADTTDQYHEKSKRLYLAIQKRNIQLTITDYIFDETVTWLHYKIGHKTACEWGDKILNSQMVDMIKISDEHLHLAWTFFQKYHDQKFSLTDCTSFAVMKLSGITTTFSYDAHFSTMGFCVLSDEQMLDSVTGGINAGII